MPRKGTPKPKKTRFSDRQERFALEYIKDFDRARAVRASGYKCKGYGATMSQAAVLLKNPKVAAVVINAKLEVARKMGWDAEKTLLAFQGVYLEALADKDWSAAVSALDKIAKCYGCYEAHQKQRKYTPEELAAFRRHLQELGMEFKRRALIGRPGFDSNGYPLPGTN